MAETNDPYFVGPDAFYDVQEVKATDVIFDPADAWKGLRDEITTLRAERDEARVQREEYGAANEVLEATVERLTDEVHALQGRVSRRRSGRVGA